MGRRGTITNCLLVCAALLAFCAAGRVAVAETPAAAAALANNAIEREPIRRVGNPTATAPTTQKTGLKPGSAAGAGGGFDARRLTLALGAVIALILLLRVGLKKMFGVSNVNRSTRAVQVLSRSPVSPRHQLVVMRVGRRLLVVADGGGQMNTLSEITDPDEVAALMGQLQEDHGGRAAVAFGSLFGKMRRPYEADGGDEVERPDVDPFDPGATDGADGGGRGSHGADPVVSTTRQEVLGLMDKVRMLSRQFKS